MRQQQEWLPSWRRTAAGLPGELSQILASYALALALCWAGAILILLLALLTTGCAKETSQPLAGLCGEEKAAGAYLDFYWDDVRTHQPELWSRALTQCFEQCPEAVSCAPVRSVATWYSEGQETPDVGKENRR